MDAGIEGRGRIAAGRVDLATIDAEVQQQDAGDGRRDRPGDRHGHAAKRSPSPKMAIIAVVGDDDGLGVGHHQGQAAGAAQHAEGDQEGWNRQPGGQDAVDQPDHAPGADAGDAPTNQLLAILRHRQSRRHAGQRKGRGDGKVDLPGDDDEGHADRDDRTSVV